MAVQHRQGCKGEGGEVTAKRKGAHGPAYAAQALRTAANKQRRALAHGGVARGCRRPKAGKKKAGRVT